MFQCRLDRAGIRPQDRAGSAEAGQLQGRSDPLPHAQQLLHQPGRDRAGAGGDVEVGRPQRPDRDQGELVADHGARADARGARLVELRAFNDPVSSLVAQHGPNGQQQQIGEWHQCRAEQALANSWKPRPIVPRARRRSAACWRSAEREDPAYTVLHQNATFTAKPKSIKWKAVAGLCDGFPRRQFRGLRHAAAGLLSMA